MTSVDSALPASTKRSEFASTCTMLRSGKLFYRSPLQPSPGSHPGKLTFALCWSSSDRKQSSHIKIHNFFNFISVLTRANHKALFTAAQGLSLLCLTGYSGFSLLQGSRAGAFGILLQSLRLHTEKHAVNDAGPPGWVRRRVLRFGFSMRRL